MKILLVNKFLYPNGGSETYLFRLGEQLTKLGHDVWYFGMNDSRNLVGNPLEAATKQVDFRTGKWYTKLAYPFRILYSRDARKQIRRILKQWKPDVVHLQNINFQITPSILTEIKKHGVPIVWTLHDYQLICPNHMLFIPERQEVCEQCLMHGYSSCAKNRCIHGSKLQSILGAVESMFYHKRHTYRKVDAFICPSRFLEQKLAGDPDINGKTVTLHNFIQPPEQINAEKEDYVLYFGRFDQEKGIETLLSVCQDLPDIPFVFAGSGALEESLGKIPNIKNVGFQTGKALHELIAKARFTVYPAEWYENCPFSVMESQMFGTPVIGSRIGGIPELIREQETGLLFEPGSHEELKTCIQTLWNDRERLEAMSHNCKHLSFDSLEEYTNRILNLYRELI